jgi:methionyl-tRNA formyltransferase
MLKKDDGLIDWTQDVLTIRNRIRGLTPWPGAYTALDGKTLKVYRTRIGSGNGAPGTVLQAAKTGLEVACGNGSLWIDELQLEGKKRLPATEFLAGCRIEPGTMLGQKETTA